jgi:hypothetical protein
VWIPDGCKDTPADRDAPRRRLLTALDEAFAETLPPAHVLDAVEPKLFGIGSESYVVGSFEFYFGYAVARQKLLCLDAGHFHPTESVADKLSAALLHVPAVLLHVSRGVRWDSDHVPILDDATLALAREAVAGGHLPRLHLELDYFDASINRVAAWELPEGAADRAAGTDRAAAASGECGGLHHPAGMARGSEIPALGRALGRALPALRNPRGRGLAGGSPPLRTHDLGATRLRLGADS